MDDITKPANKKLLDQLGHSLINVDPAKGVTFKVVKQKLTNQDKNRGSSWIDEDPNVPTKAALEALLTQLDANTDK